MRGRFSLYAARSAGAADSVSVVATHGLFCQLAEFRLKALPLESVLVTDTIEPRSLSLPVNVVSVASEVAQRIRAHHHDG